MNEPDAEGSVAVTELLALENRGWERIAADGLPQSPIHRLQARKTRRASN